MHNLLLNFSHPKVNFFRMLKVSYICLLYAKLHSRHVLMITVAPFVC